MPSSQLGSSTPALLRKRKVPATAEAPPEVSSTSTMLPSSLSPATTRRPLGRTAMPRTNSPPATSGSTV